MTTEEILHAIKAYHYYLHALTYCCFDKITAEYIKEHWDEDYNIVEECGGSKYGQYYK